jgi:hypothetical protein
VLLRWVAFRTPASRIQHALHRKAFTSCQSPLSVRSFFLDQRSRKTDKEFGNTCGYQQAELMNFRFHRKTYLLLFSFCLTIVSNRRLVVRQYLIGTLYRIPGQVVEQLSSFAGLDIQVQRRSIRQIIKNRITSDKFFGGSAIFLSKTG